MSARVDPRFDRGVHALTRLRLCAILRPLQSAEFGTLTSMLNVSEANLSKTIRNLAELGYVATSKQPSSEREDARRTTSVWLTAAGKQAFDGHIAALQALSAPDEP